MKPKRVLLTDIAFMYLTLTRGHICWAHPCCVQIYDVWRAENAERGIYIPYAAEHRQRNAIVTQCGKDPRFRNSASKMFTNAAFTLAGVDYWKQHDNAAGVDKWIAKVTYSRAFLAKYAGK